MGVELATTRLEEASAWAKLASKACSTKRRTGDVSSRCSRIRSSPRAAAWIHVGRRSEVRHRAFGAEFPAVLAASE